MTKLLQK